LPALDARSPGIVASFDHFLRTLYPMHNGFILTAIPKSNLLDSHDTEGLCKPANPKATRTPDRRNVRSC
jgi:hypothetical protein